MAAEFNRTRDLFEKARDEHPMLSGAYGVRRVEAFLRGFPEITGSCTIWPSASNGPAIDIFVRKNPWGFQRKRVERLFPGEQVNWIVSEAEIAVEGDSKKPLLHNLFSLKKYLRF